MVLLAALTCFLAEAQGCTGIKLTAKDGSTVHGRTFEFGIKVDTSIAVVPRGYAFSGTTPSGKGLTYTAKYGAVGAICFDHIAMMDGMNETGLSVGTFYLPGYAKYTPTTSDNQPYSLSPVEFPNWILTQFASLDEVKKALGNVYIAPTVIKGWGDTPPPFHYIVYDKQGHSITIEPLDSKLVVTDNPLGVLTNSPTFDWHMTNLRNYINLRAENVNPLQIGGVEFAPFGQGSGMVGLPGDFTPPSRFVRAAIFSMAAIPPENGSEGVFQVFHILNQFDIPVGIARQQSHGVTYTDYTIVTAARNPSTLQYFFRTYEDQTIRVVNLKAFDLTAHEIRAVSTASKQPYIDISEELKPLTH